MGESVTKCTKCGETYGRHRSAMCSIDGELHRFRNIVDKDAIITHLRREAKLLEAGVRHYGEDLVAFVERGATVEADNVRLRKVLKRMLNCNQIEFGVCDECLEIAREALEASK